jgi:hypothetical protein
MMRDEITSFQIAVTQLHRQHDAIRLGQSENAETRKVRGGWFGPVGEGADGSRRP